MSLNAADGKFPGLFIYTNHGDDVKQLKPAMRSRLTQHYLLSAGCVILSFINGDIFSCKPPLSEGVLTVCSWYPALTAAQQGNLI